MNFINRMVNIKTFSTLAFLVIFLGFGLQSCSKTEIKSEPNSDKVEVLRTEQRKLWSDHMHWTLATVDAFFYEPSQLNSKLARLMQNQEDIGNSIKPYYGAAAGDQLTALLKEHIQLAVPVLTAAKNGDQSALGTAVADWKVNAKEIADFLTSANDKNWPASVTEPHMEGHIDQTIDYSVKVLTEDYAGGLTSFEFALNHMLGLADVLTNGISKQFPDKF
ncbi:MAG TPA: hypothetical protein VLZ83_05195 [Edaphocola sp.]|nr:hypothetical protein [Edaphocola sp.]